MPQKLEPILEKVKTVKNPINKKLIYEFYDFLQSRDTSINYQKDNLNILIRYTNFLSSDLDFYHIEKSEQILSFLDSKKRNKDDDPEQRGITTWNDYLLRLKYFFRWLHNINTSSNPEDWITPEFARIRKKKTKRLSPYSDSDIFDHDQLLKIIKYESHKINKAILTLLWDLNARPQF